MLHEATDSLCLEGFVHLYYLCVCVCIRVELYMCLHARVCLFCCVLCMCSLCVSGYVCVCVCVFLTGDEPVLDRHVRSNWVRPQVLCAETARALQRSASLTWHKHWLGQQHCHLQTTKHNIKKHTLGSASLVLYVCWMMIVDILIWIVFTLQTCTVEMII